METVVQSLAWMFVSTSTLCVPLFLVSSRLPRRSGFGWRIALGVIALAAFQLLYVPDGPLSTATDLPDQVLISGVLFFSANVLIMGGIVLFCHRTGLAGAAFCAVVGYTVENLAASVGNIAGLVLGEFWHVSFSPVPQFYLMSLRMLLSATFIYTLFYLCFVAKIKSRGIDISPGRGVYLFLIAVILFNVVFDIASKRFLNLGMPMGYVLLSRAAVIAMCIYTLMLEYEMLYNRHMQAEAAATARLMTDWKAQYELSRDTIEAINVKCHDIRHQIRHLEDGAEGQGVVGHDVLAEIAREVNVYDATVKTGNDALDTILTEKSLLAEREGITLSCIADGEALSFMSPAEIYSLFGNAIENAFEAVREIDDVEQRVISLMVKSVAGMVSIHVENRFAGALEFRDRVPVSTKGDDLNHGFGFKSMQLIVERYNGSITSDADGQTFILNVLIPIPS